MDKNLYRGKRIDTGEWVYGGYSRYNLTADGVVEKPSIIDYENDCLWNDVVPETVGQSTGLVDMYGNTIHEGDIIKHKYGYLNAVDYHLGRYYPFVAFPEYRCWSPEDCEVIGNIHDNPELLITEITEEE